MTDRWLERPRTIRILWIVFAVILAATVVAQVVIHPHGVFGIDGSFAFNAWYGFLACVAMILFARLLGAAIKRRDTYYDE
jgi:hypothetical protein